MKRGYMWLVVACMVWMSACSSGSAGQPEQGLQPPPESSQPSEPKQETTVPPQAAAVNFFCGCDEATANFIKEQTEKKYGHITVKPIIISQQNSLDNVLTAGTQLDVLFYSLGGLYLLKDRELISDLEPLIKAHRYDTGSLAAGALETMRSFSESGKLEYMPVDQKPLALFYNKAIFDKFAVGYPKDGLTWTETTDLARRLTREDSGVVYYGINFNIQQMLYKNQLGLPFADGGAKKPLVQSDGWKNWMETMSALFKIPGMGEALNMNFVNQFQKDQNLAMLVATNIIGTAAMDEAVRNGLQWDMAVAPNFAGRQGGQLNTSLMTIPASSTQKNAAFMVITTMLSPEVQSLRARNGIVPSVITAETRSAFVADVAYAAGKNTQALFQDVIAPPIAGTRFDGGAKDRLLIQAFRDIATGAKDVVTALREADEEYGKWILSQD